jgi:hypothetical protein
LLGKKIVGHTKRYQWRGTFRYDPNNELQQQTPSIFECWAGLTHSGKQLRLRVGESKGGLESGFHCTVKKYIS